MNPWLALILMTAIAAVNVLVVWGAGILGINGNGGLGVLPFVWGIGWTWTALFYGAGLVLLAQGSAGYGLGVVAITIPMALLLVLGGVHLWMWRRTLSKG